MHMDILSVLTELVRCTDIEDFSLLRDLLNSLRPCNVLIAGQFVPMIIRNCVMSMINITLTKRIYVYRRIWKYPTEDNAILRHIPGFCAMFACMVDQLMAEFKTLEELATNRMTALIENGHKDPRPKDNSKSRP
jgi:hypothetical protein